MADDIHVDPQDPGLSNSPKGSRDSDGASLAAVAGHEACYWNGNQYSDGATVCDNHNRYECWNGRWVDIGLC